jgi:hypothetical protein
MVGGGGADGKGCGGGALSSSTMWSNQRKNALGCRWDKDVGSGVVSSGRKYSGRFSTKKELKCVEWHLEKYTRIGVAFFKDCIL